MAVTAGVIFVASLVQVIYMDRGIEALRARGVELSLGGDGAVAVGKELLEVLAANGLAVPSVDVSSWRSTAAWRCS